MKVEIEISEQEIKDLELIRDYFFTNNEAMLKQSAYYNLDKLVKKLTNNVYTRYGEQDLCCCDNPNGFKEIDDGKVKCSQCEKPY